MLYCDYLNRLSLVQRAGAGFVPVECTDASRGSGHALLGRRQCKHPTAVNIACTATYVKCDPVSTNWKHGSRGISCIYQSINQFYFRNEAHRRKGEKRFGFGRNRLSGFLYTGLCWKLMAVARETYSPDPLVGHEMGCGGNEGNYEGANRDG